MPNVSTTKKRVFTVFLFDKAIQYDGVMRFLMNPELSPTYYYPAMPADYWDIVFISQLENSATCITVRDYILGIRNPHFGWRLGFGYLYVI